MATGSRRRWSIPAGWRRPGYTASCTPSVATMPEGNDHPVADENYDVIAIGTSQGGRFLPVDLAKAGKKVALVERGQLGGVCVNTGCTPTKTPGLPGAPLRGVRRAHWSGVGGPGRGARAQAGHGRRLAAELRELVIVIDAGTRPKPLAITGLGDVRVLDSTSIMELDELPEHLSIPGGGYIGPEFGQIFRRFGSEVTIVQSAPPLLMIEAEALPAEPPPSFPNTRTPF